MPATRKDVQTFECGHEGTEVAGELLLWDHLAAIKALHAVLVESQVRPAFNNLISTKLAA